MKMSNNNVMNEKKKALLAYKEKLLEEIKYYEQRIDDFRANQKNNSNYDDAHSSDSEDCDFPDMAEMGPKISQLKLNQSMLKTCLQATQELTCLTVLQSEVNVLGDPPELNGERPVTEPGLWIEVTAECRIDLVLFTVFFYVHRPYDSFALPAYRCLSVVPVKIAHDMELAKSVLVNLKLPSDAIEVMRSYSAAYRSRRTTLARLANKYANTLFMEPLPEGGFVLKCADLLEVSWRLENKWSPVAPFHHRMKFDLEYMDESYIKIITQAHKQLLDPSIQTDERTLLLSKIINTCLEARGPINPESDLDSKTERDNESEKRDRDSEVMAPPKSLPKKHKVKKDSNSAQKRSLNDDDDRSSKRMKNIENESSNDVVGSRKTKSTDVVSEGVKRSKVESEGDGKSGKVTSNTRINGNTKPKNKSPKDSSNIDNAKAKNTKEKENTEVKNSNTKPKNKSPKETGNPENKIDSNKAKTVKESNNVEVKNSNTKPKNKSPKETGNIDDKIDSNKAKNVKESANAEVKNSNTKPKNKSPKQSGNTVNIVNGKPKNTKVNDSGAVEKAGTTKSKNNSPKESDNIIDMDGKIISNDEDQPEIGNTKKHGNTKPKKSSKDGNTVVKNANAGNIDHNKDAKPKNIKEPSNIANKANSKPTNNPKETGNTKVDDKPKNFVKKKSINVASTKNPIKNTENVADEDINIQKSKVAVKKTTVAISKNAKISSKPTVTMKKNVASAKSDEIKKTTETNAKNNDKTELTRKDVNTVKDRPTSDTNTVKKFTEKHATNYKNNDKITDKIIKEKNTVNVPLRVKVNNTKKIDTNSAKKVPAITKTTIQIPSHRISVKVPNSNKVFKSSNTKVLTSNTEKENGGQKKSKIPQKKMSPISESSSKKNLLIISPRRLPSKFKTTLQADKITKTTNIPRFVKDSAPKRT